MNSFILSCTIINRLVSLALERQLVKKKENIEFKPALLCSGSKKKIKI